MIKSFGEFTGLSEGKTHPDIVALSKIYKGKVSYGQLTVPFEKGTSIEQAVKEFMNKAPQKWKDVSKGDTPVYEAGDITVAFNEYSGKVFAQVNEK